MDKRYITGTIFLTIAVIIAVVFVQDQYATKNLIQENINAKNNELEGQRSLISEIDSIQKELASKLDRLNKVDEILPKSASVADILVNMEFLTSRNGLEIRGISFSGPITKDVDGKGKYSVMRVNLQTAGSYTAFLNFNNDITKSSNLMDARKVSIYTQNIIEDTSKEGGDSTTVHDPTFFFNYEIDIYYQS